MFRRNSLRQFIGATLIDLPRLLYRTWFKGGPRRQPGWVWNRNRDDDVTSGPNGDGVICNWRYTRALHATRVFPELGALLLRRMLRDRPIELHDAPSVNGQSPEVSFIIGHRGTARLPHLLLTLRSIAAQRDVAFECIVVEQAFEPELKEKLPSWVRYHYTKTPAADYLYNRSWALNEGARIARGQILILHDGDMLVPVDYAAETKHQIEMGFDVVNLKRFIAFLNEHSTTHIFRERTLSGPLRSDEIMSNATAGGSIGIRSGSFFSLGAMDEEFIGWGGEDTEFWDRCQTLRVANHTYMPIVHLWHPSQPGKAAVNGLGQSTAELFNRRMSRPAAERIVELLHKNHVVFGNTRNCR